jgi:hypothetical protein
VKRILPGIRDVADYAFDIDIYRRFKFTSGCVDEVRSKNARQTGRKQQAAN